MTASHTLHDRYDLPLGTTSAAAAAAYRDGLDRLLTMQTGVAERLTEAVALDDGFALAQAALALYHANRFSPVAAREHLARANALADSQERRVRQVIAGVAAMVGGDLPTAHRLMREHLTEYPRDALVLSTLARLQASTGRADWPQARLALFEEVAPHYGDDWWYLGMVSFAYHEVDRFDEALRLGERALAARPTHTHAAHSVAHVHYERGEHAAGVRFVDGWLGTNGATTGFRSHLGWHLALHQLALGREAEAVASYERTVAQPTNDDPNRLTDAASFLWRWRIYGLGEGAPTWEWPLRFASEVAATPGRAMFDAQAALAYVGAGETVALGRLIDGLRALATKGNAVTAEVVLPLVEGIAAFGQADYATAVGHLEPIADQVVRIGGSHAQREVFEDTLIQALLRAGQTERAAARLRQRLEHRHSARDAAWLTQAVPPATPA